MTRLVFSSMCDGRAVAIVASYKDGSELVQERTTGARRKVEKGKTYSPSDAYRDRTGVAQIGTPPRSERVKATLSKNHKPTCRFRLAETCAIPVECEHGYDVCPECDPCTCGVTV